MGRGRLSSCIQRQHGSEYLCATGGITHLCINHLTSREATNESWVALTISLGRNSRGGPMPSDGRMSRDEETGDSGKADRDVTLHLQLPRTVKGVKRTCKHHTDFNHANLPDDF